METNMLRPEQAAAALGVSTATLARWVRLGKIESVRLPSGHNRFHRDEIEAYVRDIDADAG